MERLLVMTCGLIGWAFGVAAWVWAIAGGPSAGTDTKFVWVIGLVVALLGGTMFQQGRRLPAV